MIQFSFYRDKKYVQDFFRNLIGRTVGMVMSQPFEVITIRMMAQFVGGETKYVLVFCEINIQ